MHRSSHSDKEAKFLSSLRTLAFGVDQAGVEAGLSDKVIAQVHQNVKNVADIFQKIYTEEGFVAGQSITKKHCFRDTEKTIRGIVRQIQTSPNMTLELRQQLGINTRDAVPTATELVPPVDLDITPDDRGTLTLTWKRGANKPGTRYVIEWKVGSDSGFSFAGLVTRCKFVKYGRPLNLVTWFRIAAQRGGKMSAWSEPVSIYEESLQANKSLKLVG